MIDIKKEEQEIQNKFISFYDFMRLFTIKNPDVSLKKISNFIINKIPTPFSLGVVFVGDDFFKIKETYHDIFFDYLYSFENNQTLGKNAEGDIEHTGFDGFFCLSLKYQTYLIYQMTY